MHRYYHTVGGVRPVGPQHAGQSNNHMHDAHVSTNMQIRGVQGMIDQLKRLTEKEAVHPQQDENQQSMRERALAKKCTAVFGDLVGPADVHASLASAVQRAIADNADCGYGHLVSTMSDAPQTIRIANYFADHEHEHAPYFGALSASARENAALFPESAKQLDTAGTCAADNRLLFLVHYGGELADYLKCVIAPKVGVALERATTKWARTGNVEQFCSCSGLLDGLFSPCDETPVCNIHALHDITHLITLASESARVEPALSKLSLRPNSYRSSRMPRASPSLGVGWTAIEPTWASECQDEHAHDCRATTTDSDSDSGAETEKLRMAVIELFDGYCDSSSEGDN